MSTHAPTPGPWTAKRSRHGGYAVECRGRLTNPSSTAVCSVRVYPRTLEAHAEAAATARLIATAPESVAANKHAAMAFRSLRGLDSGQQLIVDAVLSLLDAAIAKAESAS